jgi:hypothetical protein
MAAWRYIANPFNCIKFHEIRIIKLKIRKYFELGEEDLLIDEKDMPKNKLWSWATLKNRIKSFISRTHYLELG